MTQRRPRALSWTGMVTRGVSPELSAGSAGHSWTRSLQSFRNSREVAEGILNASADVLDTVGALTAEDASADLDPAVVESILGRFNDIVIDATVSGERVNPISLHRSLREAIASVVEEPPGPDSWQPVAMMGLMQSGERARKGDGSVLRTADPTHPGL